MNNKSLPCTVCQTTTPHAPIVGGGYCCGICGNEITRTACAWDNMAAPEFDGCNGCPGCAVVSTANAEPGTKGAA